MAAKLRIHAHKQIMARQAHAVHCPIGVGEIPEKVRRITHRALPRQFVAARFRCSRHLIVTARADGTSGGITVKLDQVVHHGIKQGGRHQGQFTIALLDTQFETAAFLGVQVRIAKDAEPLIKRWRAKTSTQHNAERQVILWALRRCQAACRFPR